jgi:HAD superfamily hydrolase (TIGR01509 family)
LFLDYARIAAAVGAVLGLPLTGPGLAAGARAAARVMEAPRASDRERAAAYLEALFLEAGVPAARMAEVRETLTRLHGERHLWSGVAADTPGALTRLRAAGLRLGVVSNSDGRVEEALEAAGLRRYLDVVVDSTLAGVEKPDPAIFRAALDALGVAPSEALYVGDLYDVDVIGANAAGIRAVLLLEPGGGAPAGCAAVASIGALADDLLKERFAS